MPLGVDEAGKGPVLGSMFAAAVYCDDPDALPAGIADSKRLAPARREDLAATLCEDDRIAVGVAEITVARIDDPETDMNSLAVAAHAEAIADAVGGLESTRSVSGLCDACDTDAERFAQRVHEACAKRTDIPLEIDARHGADDESPIVGAASIVAKVERDAHVARLGEKYGEVGSGYPSDPATREFLESYVDGHGELPACARESWSTCRDVLAAAQQTELGQF
ncbi:ribonuclease HII [Natrarchaeobaculum sulfurireducens]|uniref:Ribonuclease HII n=1 Tax=Natrarchaeobaculum sulfurireducens TaxID=2044521 RepID=A0A346PMC8_9EURY|nr:ribonuclease HII [Natrarchaeobaculum sulfurireducens]AXR80673.1 Ribonuclease HII [Natrarchaeobaculum sulfurireducens]